NPYAMITSGQMLLAWLGRKRNAPKASAAAERIQAAVKTVIAGRKHLTRDRETPSPWPCKDSCDKPRRSNRRYIGRTTMRIHLAKPAPMLALATALPAAAWAQAPVQSWPQRSIKMIVPFPAGGGTDFIARLAAKHLSERLGQQVFVENRAGANGA